MPQEQGQSASEALCRNGWNGALCVFVRFSFAPAKQGKGQSRPSCSLLEKGWR